MDDKEIIGLFNSRNEEAVRRVAEKDGGYCMSIALRILINREDSEECVNETWWKTWNAIPPQCPSVLSCYLGRITRNLAIDRIRGRGNTRYAEALEELSECAASGQDAEKRYEASVIADVINRWLELLPREKRAVFILRYFYLKPIAEVADDLRIARQKRRRYFTGCAPGLGRSLQRRIYLYEQ